MIHRYFARIELTNPTPEAHRALVGAMASAGFVPAEAGLGESALSAGAEFVRDVDQNLDEVFESARLAAAQIGTAFSVLVTEASSRRWIGVRVCRRAS